jgi:hypothetical protein
VSCKKEDTSGGGNTAIEIAEADKIQKFSANGTSVSLTFTAKAPWTASIVERQADNIRIIRITDTVDWVSIDPPQGNAGNSTITITLKPNDTEAERKADIIITSNGENTTIEVTQSADENNGGGFRITAVNVDNSIPQIAGVKGLLSQQSGNDEVVAQALYQNNGFVLELPETPEEKYLSLATAASIELTVSDINAKLAEFAFLKAYNASDNYMGEFYLKTIIDHTEYAAWWMYADRDVTLTGENITTEFNGGRRYEDTTLFNMQLKKGWNTIYGSTIENDMDSIITTTATITNQKPSVDITWEFDSALDNIRSAQRPIEAIGRKNLLFQD